jgi:hypothetical protein
MAETVGRDPTCRMTFIDEMMSQFRILTIDGDDDKQAADRNTQKRISVETIAVTSASIFHR